MLGGQRRAGLKEQQHRTCRLILLDVLLQRVVAQELRKGLVLLQEVLVGSHLRDFAIYQDNDVVNLRQEADAMGHQNSGLDRMKKSKSPQLSAGTVRTSTAQRPPHHRVAGHGHVQVKCSVLVSHSSFETQT